MKNYQDTETGRIWAFEDDVNPFKLNNRNIPTTLSETVILKPSESHVWFNGNWIKDTDVPKDYKPPASSVPCYNPAWVAFLSPYPVILLDAENKWEISLEQINLNSYDGKKLSEAVTTLPLADTQNINALISYDGAIAIPRNADYPSKKIALDNINRIFCAILLGGVHAEIVTPNELFCGSLETNNDVFVYSDGQYTRFRHNWASITERMRLMNPRTLQVLELRKAYLHGISVINAIENFSPFFLLHGYSAMVYQNWSDALSSLWIVVEQLTSFLWNNRFSCDPSIDLQKLIATRKSLKKDCRISTISVRHELLLETKFISDNCFKALSSAREKRNDLVHDGTIPDFEVIKNLWECLFELFEVTSGINSIGMRRLIPQKVLELGFNENNNFDEWIMLSDKLQNC